MRDDDACQGLGFFPSYPYSLHTTRPVMYVSPNIERLLCNVCRSGRAVRATYAVSMSVFFRYLSGKQIASLLGRIIAYSHLWSGWLHRIYPHYLIKGMISGRRESC